MDDELYDLKFEHKRCIELYTSGVLHHASSIFTQSAFIEIIIRLNDILQALDKRGTRVDFKEDISGKGICDITDLVNKLRNAACHERTSGEKKVESITFVFNRMIGKIPNAIKIGELTLGSDYEDDIAFFYGDKRIYLIRHIERLLNEINNVLYEEE